MALAESNRRPAEVAAAVRLIAFYLPQFHPIPENDRWWGAGFTEWTNVAKARPLFKGHHQPNLPADLGFYDLRLPETRQAQAELAAAHGLHGFCYYHYWFNGQRLLERPFNDVLASGTPDFPFCLCWANETWSRRWLGEEQSVLMKQAYSIDDDVIHARWLLRAFADSRYLTVAGRPLFLVYRPKDLPEPEKTTEILRTEAVKAGLAEPYLVGVDAHSPGFDFRARGFDSTLAFEPQLGSLPRFMLDGPSLFKLGRNLRRGLFNASLKIYDDGEARAYMARRQRSFPYIRSVFVGWDNTARRGENAIVVVNSTPDTFEEALANAIATHRPPEPDAPIFVNAWNEWAEGNYLEPDQRNGLAYLRRLRKLVVGA